MGRGRAQSGGKQAVTVPLRVLTGSRESLLSCTLTASEEAMAVLEEVILYAFQQCVYYVSKVRQGQGVCLTLPWAGRAGDLGRTEVLLPPSPEGFELPTATSAHLSPASGPLPPGPRPPHPGSRWLRKRPQRRGAGGAAARGRRRRCSLWRPEVVLASGSGGVAYPVPAHRAGCRGEWREQQPLWQVAPAGGSKGTCRDRALTWILWGTRRRKARGAGWTGHSGDSSPFVLRGDPTPESASSVVSWRRLGALSEGSELMSWPNRREPPPMYSHPPQGSEQGCVPPLSGLSSQDPLEVWWLRGPPAPPALDECGRPQSCPPGLQPGPWP